MISAASILLIKLTSNTFLRIKEKIVMKFSEKVLK